MSELISLMIQVSLHPLLIAPRNLAGALLDSIKIFNNGNQSSNLSRKSGAIRREKAFLSKSPGWAITDIYQHL